MGWPNFLIIGDTKAGSTSLYSYLKQHPEVFMPAGVKELRYFAFDAGNPYHVRSASYRVRTAADYLRYFERTGDAKAIGEASPAYLRAPGAAERIKQQASESKLIVSLRNPADRLHSLYQMHYRARSTTASFEEYLFSQNSTWIKGNFTWSELARYFTLFERRKLRVLLLDDLISDAAASVAGLYAFLEVDPGFHPKLTVENTGGMPRNAVVYSALVASKKILKRMGSAPEPVRRTWANVKRRSLSKTAMSPEVRRRILEICKDDILRTQDLIDRDLSGWLS